MWNTLKGLEAAPVFVRVSRHWFVRMFMSHTVKGLVPVHLFFLVSKGLVLFLLNVHIPVDLMIRYPLM